MKQITAVLFTIYFLAINLVFPKFFNLYLHWIGYTEGEDYPIGVMFTLMILWIGQVAIGVYLWHRAFNDNTK
jgi:hypothetical protein